MKKSIVKKNNDIKLGDRVYSPMYSSPGVVVGVYLDVDREKIFQVRLDCYPRDELDHVLFRREELTLECGGATVFNVGDMVHSKYYESSGEVVQIIITEEHQEAYKVKIPNLVTDKDSGIRTMWIEELTTLNPPA